MNPVKNPYHVGYWAQTVDEKGPFPCPQVKKDLPVEIRLEYLKLLDLAERSKDTNIEYYKGWSTCRLCHCTNGSMEFDLTIDGVGYIWPEGYKHYILTHDCDIDYKFYEALKKKFNLSE